MRKVIIALGLLLLLITAEQSAVLHELGHICRAANTEVRVDTDQSQQTCQLCLAFAQLGNLTSHSIHIPHFDPAPAHCGPEPRYSVTAADVPTPRSRGPPALG